MSENKPKIDVSISGMTPSQADHIMMAVKGANAALWQLEALFQSIEKELEDAPSASIKALANLGHYHAMDQANITDRMVRDLEFGKIA